MTSTRTPNAFAIRSKFKKDAKPPALVPKENTRDVLANVGTSRARKRSRSLAPQKYVGFAAPLTVRSVSVVPKWRSPVPYGT
jgi:hypothetical protein